MTLNELAATSPNGFHDAAVHSINIDYSKHEIRFNLNVWIGDVSSKDELKKETCRKCILTISDVVFCVIEPPDPKYTYDNRDEIIIDTGEISELRQPILIKLPKVPVGTFVNWIYVMTWNSFIYVAARNAQI